MNKDALKRMQTRELMRCMKRCDVPRSALSEIVPKHLRRSREPVTWFLVTLRRGQFGLGMVGEEMYLDLLELPLHFRDLAVHLPEWLRSPSTDIERCFPLLDMEILIELAGRLR